MVHYRHRLAALVMDFFINFGPSSSLATLENSTVPLDSGVTWQRPINLPNFTDTGTLDVDINGNLFVGGGGSPFWCLRSSNAQNGRSRRVSTKHLRSTWVAILFRVASME